MKKLYILSALMLSTIGAMAQDSYLNDRMTNNSNGLHGTARFVGMGGAMSALGADISTMSWNPAGIGVMRRTEFTITAGAGWDQKGSPTVNKSHGTFDQMGGVFSLPLSKNGLKYINFGFNYQKKIDFNNSFTVGGALNGLSQMDQLTTIANRMINNKIGPRDGQGYLLPNIASMAAEDMLDHNTDEKIDPMYMLDYNEDRDRYENHLRGEGYDYWQHTWGGLNSFDFNVSGNVEDRLFWGVTFGFDQLRYRAANEYYEESQLPVAPGETPIYGDYSVYSDQAVNGYGINAKLGLIVRPIEDNPFRFSFVLETPTKYSVRTNSSMQMEAHYDLLNNPSHTQCYSNAPYCTDDYYGHPFRYALTSPMKMRFGLGSTISNFFAFDVDYEFANTHNTRMGYFREDYRNVESSLFQTDPDNDMNELTKRNFRNTHTLRVGLEGKLSDMFALRAGFNYISSANKDKAGFSISQLTTSDALKNATGTYFMTMKPTYLMTLGMGYHFKHVNLDLAYKCSSQKANFHPFDDGDAKISIPLNENKYISETAPANLNLVRHQVTATLGIRF